MSFRAAFAFNTRLNKKTNRIKSRTSCTKSIFHDILTYCYCFPKKSMRRILVLPILLSAMVSLLGCVIQPQPHHIDNICHIFKQYPRWHRDAKDVERRWKVPVAVQMAIIHQESKFNAQALPQRNRLLGIIPWNRPSSAYGYTQALKSTWALYRRAHGNLFTTRDNFADGVDFIGWYANQAYIKAHIPRNNAYLLYLAYHEGVGGYQKKTYLKKKWLMPVAHKVAARTQLYQAQLASCA